MKLKIIDIPAGGLDFDWEGGRDPWFGALLHDLLPQEFVAGQTARLGLHFDKVCDNVMMNGWLEATLVPQCARCLESFEYPWNLPLALNLAPAPSVTTLTRKEAEGTEADDEGFSFYHGDEIDVSDILRELILLEAPLRHLCQEDCRGLCPKCGENLNLRSCRCPPERADSPFKVLKGLLARG